jgi:nucleoside-diphosphate-sugar epimerase
LLALDRLAEPGLVGGKAYFLSQGEPVNCWGWINEVLKLAGLPHVRKLVPFRAAYVVGGALELGYRVLGKMDEEPLMTRFLACQLAMDHYFSLKRAEQDLGYHPQISMHQGMLRLRAWIHK